MASSEDSFAQYFDEDDDQAIAHLAQPVPRPELKLRRSLQLLLSSPLFCNVAWRSTSRIFDLGYWIEHCNEASTFEARVTAHVDAIEDLAAGERELFRRLGAVADRLEAKLATNDYIVQELGSSATNFLPIKTVETVFDEFMYCIILDRMLWSLEANVTPFPDQSRRVHVTPELIQDVESYSDLENNAMEFLRAIGASKSQSIEIDTAQKSIAHVVAAFLSRSGNQYALSDLHKITGHVFQWCALFTFGIDGFSSKKFADVADVIRSHPNTSLKEVLTDKIKSFDFRDLKPLG
ncbi:hypothetical protein SISSUDRAFT_1067993 [Sistotremastrum suecicum HHB10207 ss-3]|uniref:Uncharacterized protein n=1 Tax=Sistotremastrum suecicum HHB10207 ss-3 TaxID=1314776 RepID=A0A165WIA7_9AGAM|nr:hypothetical protein SISSUDRAFT_1067993 [Sistotremastrum suecicum HHB10207 ss-3]